MKELTLNEMKQLVPVLDSQERDLRRVYNRISGGYVQTFIFNVTDSNVYAHIRFGVSSDCSKEGPYEEEIKIDRKSMLIID